jgi:predicted RNA binding protein YcfA (HicA-like mRNA interferase family)
MADRTLKLRDLKRRLGRYGVTWDESRGKGSHLVFMRTIDGGVFTYPVPTHSEDVLVCYVRGARRRFRLTAEDGVTDAAFYGKH